MADGSQRSGRKFSERWKCVADRVLERAWTPTLVWMGISDEMMDSRNQTRQGALGLLTHGGML